MNREISSLESSAKINLYLDVLAKRSDGYHNIRTIFAEIDLQDRLNFTLTKNQDIKILSSKCFVNTKDNLIYKVAIFIKRKYNVRWGAEIELEKNIPVAAGLGGGSSNAAAAITALSRLWDLDLDQVEMDDIAREFGSDINFFLRGGTALGEGRGEKITPLADLDLENIILVNPGFAVSSSLAYNSIQMENLHHPDWHSILENRDLDACYNALEPGIFRKFPVIRQISRQLDRLGAQKSLLSGSGPTVIGFFQDLKTAQKASEFYTQKDYWNIITKTKRRSTV